MKVKEILSRIFYIIVAVCVLLHVVILSLSFFDNNQQEKYCRSIIPDREYQTDEDNRRFVFSAQEIKDGENCLRFYTAHMEVSVYADDTLIYHVGQQAMPKVSPGVVWNYVEIPSGAEQIQVMIRAVYPEVRQKQIDFQSASIARCIAECYTNPCRYRLSVCWRYYWDSPWCCGG